MLGVKTDMKCGKKNVWATSNAGKPVAVIGYQLINQSPLFIGLESDASILDQSQSSVMQDEIENSF